MCSPASGGWRRSGGGPSSKAIGSGGRPAVVPVGMRIGSACACACGSSNRSDGRLTGENGMPACSIVRASAAMSRSAAIAATISRSAGRFSTRAALLAKRGSASRSGRLNAVQKPRQWLSEVMPMNSFSPDFVAKVS